jgi:osmotically inducible protein OsmC
MNRTAEAVWYGALTTGHGTISTQSGVLKDSNYSFKTRFEGDPGTNPEELIAAAHAGCFSMALSMVLNQAGMTAEKIDTKAVVTLDKKDGGFAVTKSALELRVKVPGAEPAAVEAAAHTAKENCPISKLLNAEITLLIHVE